jgi:hypothetical protein
MRIFRLNVEEGVITATNSVACLNIGELTIKEVDEISEARGTFDVFKKHGRLYCTSFGSLVHFRSYPESTQFNIRSFGKKEVA